MRVTDLTSAMHEIAPLNLAERWDRVGLLVGDPAAPLAGPVVLAIDLTERVLDEAISHSASAVIAYHPPIWEPLARVTTSSPRERVILRAIESRIAIYCPHTALDAAPGGLTDWLCEGLSGGPPGKVAGDCRALVPHDSAEPTQEVKVVTFVPRESADRVRLALASAGAGIIGNYTVCSFAGEGTGTFLGNEQSRPAVGSPGQIESVPEVRLEMVCASRALALVLETLREFHPYEHPAVDVYDLHAKPQRRAGSGRRLVLDRPATLRELGTRLRAHLGAARIQTASVGGPDDLDRVVSTLGIVPGSGGALASTARAEQCDAFITGEMKHHEVLDALHSGLSVILAGHTNTERGYLPRLAERLRKLLPGLRTHVSAQDRDPLVMM